MGLEESYTGVNLGLYNLTVDGQMTRNGYGWALIKGPADDIMLRNYEACGICREFDDMVCVMVLATIIYGNGGSQPREHLTAT